jgi:hypothetical protein
VNLQHKTAIDRLLQAVQTEDSAMANARMPHVPDVVNLMSAIINQRWLTDLRTRVDALHLRGLGSRDDDQPL